MTVKPLITSLSIALGCLCAFGAVTGQSTLAADPPHQMSVGSTRVTIAGQSGKITFWDDEVEDGAKKFKVEFNGLWEETAAGNRLTTRTFNTFANQEFKFSEFSEFDYPGFYTTETVACKSVDFTASLEVDGAPTTLTVQMFLFATTGTIAIDDQQTTVTPGHLKFNINIFEWPFDAPTDRLVLELAVKTPGRTPERAGDEVDLGDGGFLVLANTAIIDSDRETGEGGEVVDVPTSLTQNGSVGRLYFSFPAFTDNIQYDPLLFNEPEKTMQSGDIRVTISGHSGKIQFWNTAQQDTGDKLFKLEFNGIQEQTPDGVKQTTHTFNSFADQHFYFTELIEMDFPGYTAGETVSCKNIDFVTTLPIDGQVTTLTVETYLFTAAGHIAVDGEPFNVDEGHLKFNIKLESWPFYDPANELVLELAVKTPSGATERHGAMVDLGDEAYLALASTAEVDGGMIVDVTTTLTEHGSVDRLYFTFPSFLDTLTYDPIVYSSYLSEICVNSYDSFVEQQYQDFLRRGADDGGRRYYIRKLCEGSLTLAETVRNFIGSPEFAENNGYVARCYFALMNDNSQTDNLSPDYRFPDYGGQVFWNDIMQDVMARGGSRTDAQRAVVLGFMQSPEWQGLVGDLSDEEFIRALYERILGRAAETGGFEYHLRNLSQGLTGRGELARQFVESPEAADKYRHRVAAAMAYVGLLARTPDRDGFIYYTSLLESGALHDLGMLNGFVYSDEYAARLASLGGTHPGR